MWFSFSITFHIIVQEKRALKTNTNYPLMLWQNIPIQLTNTTKGTIYHRVSYQHSKPINKSDHVYVQNRPQKIPIKGTIYQQHKADHYQLSHICSKRTTIKLHLASPLNKPFITKIRILPNQADHCFVFLEHLLHCLLQQKKR